MKRTIMISQPMKDLSSEKIIKIREKAIRTLETFGYDVIDNFFTDDGFISQKKGFTYKWDSTGSKNKIID